MGRSNALKLINEWPGWLGTIMHLMNTSIVDAASVPPYGWLLLIALVVVIFALKQMLHAYRLNDPFYRLKTKEDSRVEVGRR